jgi:hypothetical protein
MNDERMQMKQWVEHWTRVGPLLESFKRKELCEMNIAQVIEDLSDAFEAALRMNPPRPTSGLFIQQRLFRKLSR